MAVSLYAIRDNPRCQRPGSMQAKNTPATRLRVKPAGKACLGPCALIAQWKGSDMGRKALRQPFAVSASLDLDSGKRGSLLLGLDDSGRGAVDIQQVVSETVPWLQRKLPDCYTSCSTYRRNTPRSGV